ncbi:MAG: hypothetical protein RLZZ558_783 [Planctomycetota bacterium]|jgi:excisionase family DNA binding protein
MNAMPSKPVLTTGEVASILKVAARTVSKWIDSGRLEGYRIPGSRDRRVRREALDAFIASHGLNALAETASTAGTRVLVVDADTATAELLAGAIRSETGHAVDSARTAFEAGVALARVAHAWVVVDAAIGMAEVTGLTAWIRATAPGTRLVITGQAFTPHDETMLRRAGATTILRKPFTLRMVLQVLEPRAAVAV